MQKEKLQYYNQLVDDKQLNNELLISCLQNLEPRISKAAYMRAKFKNSYKNSDHNSNECHEYEMKLLMSYRTLITNLLVSTYSRQDIKALVSGVEKDDIVTNKLCDAVIELVKSNDYQLL